MERLAEIDWEIIIFFAQHVCINIFHLIPVMIGLCRSMYELNFMQSKPPRGFYKLFVSVSPQKADKRLVGTSGAEVCYCILYIYYFSICKSNCQSGHTVRKPRMIGSDLNILSQISVYCI